MTISAVWQGVPACTRSHLGKSFMAATHAAGFAYEPGSPDCLDLPLPFKRDDYPIHEDLQTHIRKLGCHNPFQRLGVLRSERTGISFRSLPGYA